MKRWAVGPSTNWVVAQTSGTTISGRLWSIPFGGGDAQLVVDIGDGYRGFTQRADDSIALLFSDRVVIVGTHLVADLYGYLTG